MDSTNFVSVSISSTKEFSWVFVIYWFLLFMLTIGMIFYFNRLVGFLLTQLLKYTLWRKKKLRIYIQSIKFSLLAGRCTFKNLTIIDKDYTISILHGTLTWRYWIPTIKRTSKEVNEENFKNSSINQSINSKLPSRYLLELNGLEYFIYNRTLSFENILNEFYANKGKLTKLSKSNFDIFKDPNDILSFSNNSNESLESNKTSVEISPWIQILPLNVKINKGSIIAGNSNTEVILIGSFTNGLFEHDISSSDNPLDRGQLSIDSTLERFELSMKPNILYQKSKQNTNENNNNSNEEISKIDSQRRYYLIRKVLNLYKFIKNINNGNNSNNNQNINLDKSLLDNAESQWNGLIQYLHSDSISIPETNESKQYAKYSTIITAESIKVNYYYDIPGIVPLNPLPTNPLDGIDINNSGSAPKFGLDIQTLQTTIHYGPWAERQRHSLHQMIFPFATLNSIPHPKLLSGDYRIYTYFKINLEVLDDLIIRIPIREFSKHEEYLNLNSMNPFGWIEIKVAKDSNISLNTGMVASNSGFSNILDAKLNNMKIKTSINHDILLQTTQHNITCDLGYPLEWNGEVVWSILNESKNLELYLLREHITLISDMFTDFGSGEPISYEFFRPFIYSFDWKVQNYSFYFNLNDANIINNPLDFNDNIYLSIQGESIDINVHLPMDTIIRRSTTVDYNIFTPGFSLVLDTPPWHTLNNFLKRKEVGKSGDFNISGSYTYFPEVGLDFVDTIIIACKGKHVVLQCYGFVVKYIMAIKENYFGEYQKFKTLEEYTKSLNNDIETNDQNYGNESSDEIPKPIAPLPKKSENEIDVHFSFCVEDSAIILPGNIYDCSSNTTLSFNSLDIDIRFTNYYMDMQTNVTPIKGYFDGNSDLDNVLKYPLNYTDQTKQDILIDGLNIHGHRMFGLPPLEPTYFCKWDINLGEFIFDSTPTAIQCFFTSFVKIAFGYKNLENHLLIDEPEIFDTTSLCVIMPKIKIILNDPTIDHTINFELDNFSLKFIDMTNSRFSEKISIILEYLSISVESKTNEKVLLSLQTAFKLTNFVQKQNYDGLKKKQDDHILLHDGPFHRIPFFLDENLRDQYNTEFRDIIPSYSIPDGNPPLNNDTVDLIFDDYELNSDYRNINTSESLSSSETDVPTDSFFQDFGPDFLSMPRSPISPNNKPNKPKHYYQTVIGSNVHPLSDYLDEEFKPLKDADPNYETGNFIINVGQVNLTLTLQSLSVLLSYLEKFSEKSLVAALDDLQVAVLKKLTISLISKSIASNFRFASPRMFCYINETPWRKGDSIDLNNTDFISLSLEAPSIAGSFQKSSEGIINDTLALHVLSVVFSVNERYTTTNALKLTLNDLEYWSEKSEIHNSSVSVRLLDVSADADSAEWFISYTQKIAIVVDNLVTSFIKILETSKRARVELLYQIAKGGLPHSVNYDPGVITRPAYIIRLSRQHIRANDSWKIIIKLRHILDNLPDSWIQEKEEKYLNNKFIAPKSAMKDVLGVFIRWRSWEFADIANSFIFRYVFSSASKNNKVMLGSSFEASLDETSFRVIHKGSDENNDYVCINFVEFSTKKVPSPFKQSDPDNTLELFESNIIKISSLHSKLSPELLKFQNIQSLELPNYTLSGSTSNHTLKGSSITHILADVNKIHVTVEVGDTSIISSSSDIISSVIFHKDSNGSFSSTSTLKSRYCELEIISSKLSIASCLVGGSNIDASIVSIPGREKKIVNITNKTLSLTIDQSFQNCIKSFEYLKEKLLQLRPVVSKSQHQSNLEIKSNTRWSWDQAFSNLECKLKNKSFKLQFSSISPLLFTMAVYDFHIDCFGLNGLIFTKLFMKGANIGLKLNIYSGHLLKINHDTLIIDSKLAVIEKRQEIKIRSLSSEILLPDSLDQLIFVQNSVDEFKTSIEMLSTSFKDLFRKSDIMEEQANPVELGYRFKWNLPVIDFGSDQFSIGMTFGKDTHYIKLHDISLKFYDLSISTPSRPYGEFSIKHFRYIIDSPDIKDEKSLILDAGLLVKIVNNEQNRQTLQIESSHFRIMLSPSTILKILQLANDMNHISSTLKPVIICPSTSTSSASKRSFADIFKFSSIHMLSYNVCLGYVFDEISLEFHGFMAGCDKLFAITEDSYGKLSVISAFLSTAQGSSSDTFYSTFDQKYCYNRAFLPSMQLLYAITKVDTNRNFQINVTGEELDVKIVASSNEFAEKIFQSISTIESGRKSIRTYSNPTALAPHLASDQYMLPSDVTSISCSMNYAGGVIKMFRWEDLQVSEESAPSVELRTPAVQIRGKYSKTSKERNHNVSIEVFTHSSSNKLYHSCVPILIDMWDGIKDNFKSDTSVESQIKDSQTFSNIDLTELLSLIHVAFSLHIDKQELILSCEPSAKVQAVVSIDAIDILLETNDGKLYYPIFGTVLLGNVGASLQHTYSREISGSVDIDRMLLMASLDNPELVRISASARVDTVNSYINLKQLQDLDLFKDLWFPRSYIPGSANQSIKSIATVVESTRNDNFVLNFSKASRTSLNPWNLNFSILDVSLKVDMGQSLGELSLNLDRFWLTSRKQINKEQTMMAGFDALTLTSEGRLGGFVKIDDIRVHSVISDVVDENTLQIPHVLLSIGFRSINWRVSFDYTVFMIGSISDVSLTVFNQIDNNQRLQDKLCSIANCDSIELYITSLAASNILDIYNTARRMHQDSKTSYREDLKTSINQKQSVKFLDSFIEVVKLRTELDVNFGKMLLHVYPSSLLDEEVLVIDIKGATIHFAQRSVSRKVESDLKLKLYHITVALSTLRKQLPEESLRSLTVPEFRSYAAQARGGGIFIFPSLECHMKTICTPNSNIVEYEYQSNFGGKVDIRWNIGSINFIREMWALHARALSARLPKVVDTDKEIPLFGDENIEEKLKEVEIDEKFSYVALTEPIIQAPQLRDLGNATPPLEWFGLHRNKFPALTHQYTIIGLQRLAHEIELQYGQVLGRG
ncbi:hypothetical protein WICMUC_002746 [Wickerhamomyces mucosus]|uniref:Protein CSF1 n=1 Tax=Wickerhamomyces mucosus TaxID=1378264 RepID=A0A9P8PP27_9ASCO|nr:hypothetical protein WICMUC_002746 [Wickerhamomyces mucosus]